MSKPFVGWIEDDHRIYKCVHLKSGMVKLHELKEIRKIPYKDWSGRFRFEADWNKQYSHCVPESSLDGECDLSNCGLFPIWDTLKYNNSFRHYSMRELRLSRNFTTGKVMVS